MSFESSTLRIAMWSGPRNISTAMLRSWGNRPDCFVCDEPLYAHYLKETALPHPGADEVIASHENDWRKVVDWLIGPIPEGKPIFYQKQMAHHLLPNVDLDWLDSVANCFLIRSPREMITSLLEFIPEPSIEDTALPQQLRIFERVRERTGSTPPVLDGRDVLQDPAGMMTAFCERLGVPFDESMLHWPPGIRATDGIWAKHWYAKVEPTTGFGTYRPKQEEPPARLSDLVKRCDEIYSVLHAQRLTTTIESAEG